MRPQRVLATVLSLGGVLWGLFCLIFIIYGDTLFALLVFGPGYRVTAGYLVRACSNPSLEARVGIWVLSTLVQGGWLVWALIGVAQGEWFRGFAFEFVTLGWWAFAFAASVYGVLTERNVLTERDRESLPDR